VKATGIESHGPLKIAGDVTINISAGAFSLRTSALGIDQPSLTEPTLDWLDLSDAFDDGEPNLFSLLRWDYRLVETLFGREEDLRKILAWAEGGSRMPSARLVTGEGGAGKTRLAATAAQILRDKGWTAGFLPRHSNDIDFTVGEKGLFLILDYPEEQPERTNLVLKELAARKTAPYPLRVMFLSRRSFDEWESQTTILEGRFGRQEIATPAPLGVDDGAKLIAEAASRFVDRMKKPAPDLRAAGKWLEASPLHRLPLYATAAAVHAVLAPSEAFGLGGAELLGKLAWREIERVRRASTARSLGEQGLERLLALGVLADDLDEGTITKLAKAGACESPDSDLVETLARTPWWKNGRLARLEPDAPAAAFLDLALFGAQFPKGRPALSEWMFIALRPNAASFGNRLGRILYDLHAFGGAKEGLHPLDERLSQMLLEKPERAIIFAAVAAGELPFWAASFAATVALMLAKGTDDPELKASALNNAANYLSAVGRREEALAAAKETVQIRRELASARPEAFKPDLAMSLNNLAPMLSALGQREDALTAAKEAVQIRRELASAQPEAFTPYLAGSLNNLANILSALGQREEALAAAQESVQIRRELASTLPEAFTPHLARSLAGLATRLSQLGQWEEALATAKEAVQIHRELASTRPEAFTPDLAASLNNLANRLSALGRREEALAAGKEAVQIHRALASARPDAFMPDLAGSLSNLADRLSKLGRREEALAAAKEAADLWRTLANARPEAFTPNLAMSLNTLTGTLSGLGQREEALAAAKEAANLHRALASARPVAFTHYLAGSLNNLANILSELGQREEALAAAKEATDLYRALARAQPEAFTPNLANSLNTLTATRYELGQREEAVAAAKEAAQIRRVLASARPEAFTPDLAMSLNNLATMLSELGQQEEALAAAQEAADLYRALASARPEAFTPYRAGSLNNLANRLSELGQREEALAAAQEAVNLYRALAAAHADAFGRHFVTSLRTLATILLELGRQEEALVTAEELARLITPTS
jgi:tetratricopeptide (TPR) repeat protein